MKPTIAISTPPPTPPPTICATMDPRSRPPAPAPALAPPACISILRICPPRPPPTIPAMELPTGPRLSDFRRPPAMLPPTAPLTSSMIRLMIVGLIAFLLMSDHWRVGLLFGQQGTRGRLLGCRFTATGSTRAPSTRSTTLQCQGGYSVRRHTLVGGEKHAGTREARSAR